MTVGAGISDAAPSGHSPCLDTRSRCRDARIPTKSLATNEGMNGQAKALHMTRLYARFIFHAF